MRYYKIQWHHSSPNEPEWWYYEIDRDNYEKKRIEVYKDGSMVMVDKDKSSKDQLSETKIPSVEDIALNPEFNALEITKEIFYAIWQA